MNNIIIFLLTITSLWLIFINYVDLYIGFTFIILLFIFKKLFLRYFPKGELPYLIFLFLAYFLGIIFHFYHSFSWYDTIIHCLSGVFVSYLGYQFFKNCHSKYLFFIIFSLAMMSASMWEIWEYFLSNIINKDIQNVLTTGVSDTIKDMTCCLLGSLLFILGVKYER